MAKPKKRAKATDPLIQAAYKVRRAYLDFGPVDDGRPEGVAFEAALDKLMKAAIEAKYRTLGVTAKAEKRLLDTQAILATAMSLLTDIRYRTWPVLYDKDGNEVWGLGIGLTADRLDEVIMAEDRLPRPRRAAP